MERAIARARCRRSRLLGEWIEYRYDTRHRLVRETEYYPGGGVRRQIIVAYP